MFNLIVVYIFWTILSRKCYFVWGINEVNFKIRACSGREIEASAVLNMDYLELKDRKWQF